MRNEQCQCSWKNEKHDKDPKDEKGARLTKERYI